MSGSSSLLQNVAWRGPISSVLGQSVSNVLSKVGQLAVEGANCLVTAAVESWHAEALRYFEHELLEDAPADQLAAVRSRPPAPPLTSEELHSFMDDAGVLVDEAGFRDRLGAGGEDQALGLGQNRVLDSGLHPFYRGRDAASHLRSLRNVLRCYSLYNFDLGYCQVESFWCFVALMERLEGNFRTDQLAMNAQLGALKCLVQLHSFFEARDSLNYFFTFRWLLIHFKREFPFAQVLCLWESCWACPLTRHLHLFLAAAILIHHRRALLADPDLDFDGLLRFCVGLAGHLDLQGMLRLAEALVVIAGDVGAECVAGLQ
eukprot:gene10560-10720_t